MILFDNVQVPHYNYVGDSILGYKSHMGAGSLTSNVKSDKTLVVDKDKDELIPTGLKKFGAMVGDFVEVGCNSDAKSRHRGRPKHQHLPHLLRSGCGTGKQHLENRRRHRPQALSVPSGRWNTTVERSLFLWESIWNRRLPGRSQLHSDLRPRL